MFWAGSQRIAANTNNTKEFYFNDAQGSVKVVTNAAGNVISSSTDKPFGEDLVGVGFGPKEEFRFTGKGKDESVGLFYFNARWYDPELGRFIQKDPAEDGDNYYVYCENNPLKYTDSTGKYTDQEYNDAYSYFSTHGWCGYGQIPLSTAAEAKRRSKNAVVLPRPNNQWVIKELDDSINDKDKEMFYFIWSLCSFGAAKGAQASEPILTKVVGNKIEGFTMHAFQRMWERGIKPSQILDALRNPLKIGAIKFDKFGRPSQRIIGKFVEVVINPITKKVVSLNPTSSSKAAKLLKQIINKITGK